MSIKEIVVDAKKKKSSVEKILEERKTEAEHEYEETKLRRLIAEEKARIKAVGGGTGQLEPGLAASFSSRIMQLAQVDPAKAKAFLSSLDEESMNKLAYLMAMENDRAGALLSLAKSSGTNIKDLVEIVKLMRPGNGGVDLKGIAEVFKAGVDAAKANKPQPRTEQEGAKYIIDNFVKPFTDALTEAQKQVYAERIKRIEERIPAPLPQQIEHIKNVAGALGLSREGRGSEVDLKLEEMRQSHDIDMAKLTWEQQKFMMQTEAERDKWGAIQQTFSPIFSMAAPEIRGALKKVGQQVGRSLEGGPQGASKGASQEIANFTCPGCKAQLTVPIPPNAPEEVPIKCPKCGTVTPAKLSQKKGEKAPPEEKPRARRLGPIYR